MLCDIFQCIFLNINFLQAIKKREQHDENKTDDEDEEEEAVDDVPDGKSLSFFYY